MAVLRYQAGAAERLHEIASDLVVGRGSGSDLVLEGLEGVSRSHLRVRPSGNGHIVEDLDSRNGTQIRRGADTLDVSGAVALESGDVILAGAAELTYDATTPAALTAAPIAATHVPMETRVGGSIPSEPPPTPPPPPATAITNDSGTRWPLVIGVGLAAGVAAAAVAIALALAL